MNDVIETKETVSAFTLNRQENGIVHLVMDVVATP